MDKHLTLEQLAEQTGLSKSALGKYETDDYKDISPLAIATLADFYGVSTDYLMGLTENKNHPNTELQSLHLSDDTVSYTHLDVYKRQLDHFPLVTGDNIIGVGADALLVRPKDQMCAFIEGIPQDMADSRPSPGIIVGVKLRVGLDTGDGDFFFHQPFGNPHAAQPVKGIVIDFADDRRCLRVKDKMPFVLRVTHQTKRRRPAAELSLPGAGSDARQHLLGNIPAVHIVQDILKGCDVHLLTGQAVHAVGDGDIAYIVFGEKDFDIAASFDIISTKSGQVFGDHAADLPRLNVNDHALEGRAVES